MSNLLIAVFYPVYIVICVTLIISILLQSSKGEGLAGSFGGTGITGAVFGGRGAATFLSKATTVLAVLFFVSSLLLSFTVSGARRTAQESAIQKQAQEQRTQGGTGPATNAPATGKEEEIPIFPEEGK